MQFLLFLSGLPQSHIDASGPMHLAFPLKVLLIMVLKSHKVKEMTINSCVLFFSSLEKYVFILKS